MTTADADIAEALGLEVGDPVYERARLVKEANVPTHTLTSYYRPEDVEALRSSTRRPARPAAVAVSPSSPARAWSRTT